LAQLEMTIGFGASLAAVPVKLFISFIFNFFKIDTLIGKLKLYDL